MPQLHVRPVFVQRRHDQAGLRAGRRRVISPARKVSAAGLARIALHLVRIFSSCSRVGVPVIRLYLCRIAARGDPGHLSPQREARSNGRTLRCRSPVSFQPTRRTTFPAPEGAPRSARCGIPGTDGSYIRSTVGWHRRALRPNECLRTAGPSNPKVANRVEPGDSPPRTLRGR